MCSVFVILHTDEGPSSDILHDLFMLLMTSFVTLWPASVSQKVAGLIFPDLFLPVTL